MIVAVTAAAMKADDRTALEAGCDAYVSKPIDTRALLAGSFQEQRNQTVLWIDGSIPKRGWTTWTVSERVATLALLVAGCSLVLNTLK